MFKYISKIAAVVLALLLVHSCEDRLEIPDPNRLSSEQFYLNQDQAIAAVDAIYNVLIIDGLYQRMTPVFNDGRGDEIACRSPWVFLTGLSNFTVPGTDGANEIAWSGYYIMVLRANQALKNIPGVPDVDADLRARLLAQAYFLRGFAYFNLTNTFDKVPLILEVPEGQEAFYPANQDVTQVMIYDQIEADLQLAVPDLPVDYNAVSGPDNGQVGRATKGAALSLLGKLNLYRKDYQEAAGYFQQVVDLNVYSLGSNYADLFSQDPAVEAANPGKIFWAEFTQSANSDFNWGGDPTVNWRQFSAIAPTYSVRDFFDFYPTAFLYNEMRQELTNDNKLDPRYHATILSYEPSEGYTTGYGALPWLTPAASGGLGFQANAYFIKKYTLAATGGDPFICGINYHIIRYADVLLMYAESLANTGNISGAAQYVQMVRDRANLPDREAEFAGYDLDQFMTQLAHERIMELAIEGSRWHDIKRWGWLDDPAKLNTLKSHDAEFNTYTPDRAYMPIPQSELDVNPNLVGNSANQ